MDIEKLKEIAKKIRREIIEMTYLAGSGHPGGSLSSVEILVYLYFHKMKYDPKNPRWEERDRFVLSKGHATPVMYAVLAYAGFFPIEDLKHFRKLGSHLQGHPSYLDTSGIEASTGSLGMGLSIANGMALAGKLDNKDYRVYVLLGDGEIEEGQIWEASMTSSRRKLDNLTAILDNNDLQIDGKVSEIKNPYPLEDKWLSFGWEVFTIDGHSFEEIHRAISEAEKVRDKPSMIIAKTVKGKGISFMENRYEWHGKAPKEEERLQALKELS